MSSVKAHRRQDIRPNGQPQRSLSSQAQPLSLQRSPRQKLVETVANQLMEAVRDVQPGARMPSERELTLQLGVGRSTVREALNGLAALGVLEIRHGRGVFVAEVQPAIWGPAAIVPALIRARTHSLIEARLVVQPEVAALAAARRTKADLKAVEQAIARQERALSGSVPQSARAGADFDVRIAEAARNEVLSGMVRTLFALMLERAPRLHELIDDFGPWDVEEHRRIFEAIRDSDPAQAAKRMREHILAVDERYKSIGSS